MENRLVTLAIHKVVKAHILKNVLEAHGIEVFFEEIETENSNRNDPPGIFVKIKESDLARALTIIEENNPFDYRDKQIFRIDDGRKRILVPVDFSEQSINACNFAFNIAKIIDAKVKILHVFKRMYFPSAIPFADTLKEDNDETMLDRARKEILRLCNDIDQKITKGELPSVNYSYALREGIAEEEIEAFIDEYKPSLVVIGTKGKDQTDEDSFFGSVAANVIEMTDIPVLGIPKNSRFKDINSLKHVAFLSNLQRHDMETFDILANILKPFKGVKVTIAHINIINKKGDRWSKEEIQQKRDHFSSQYPDLDIQYKLIDTSNIVEGVNSLMEDNVDIIALNTRKRNILGRIFRPSLAHDILHNTNVVLLILRK